MGIFFFFLISTSVVLTGGFSPVNHAKGKATRGGGGGGGGRRDRFDETDGRVPLTLIPYHYNVEFFPNIYLAAPPFPLTGHVDIYFETVEATDVITIHSTGLTIDETSVTISVSPDSPGVPPTPVLTSLDENTAAQFLYFYLEDDLVAGEKYVLSMDYTGTLRSPSSGLYWDSYTESDGSTGYMAATQFESIDARSAFPCFDEPDLKATFNLTVVTDANNVALANMPIVSSSTRPGGYFAHTYDTTPIMSSYLVCICVGNFAGLVSGNINGYTVRIFSRPDLLSQMQFAVDVAAKIQAWLDSETGIVYHLPKEDHIALPSKGGAMENWGLITYGEESLAVNPETSPATGKLNVASIISHELAHQWYGDLVTCKWWDDIWLNEGFATNYNYFPTEAIGWEGSMSQQIDQRRGFQVFFDIDQKNTSDPIRKLVPTTWEAPASFSGSTYPKGGAMIRQLRAILTLDTFKAGMTRYLVAKSYTGATTDDYWQALTDQAAEDGITNPDGSTLDVKARMDPWLNQMGFPLVTVTRHADGTATLERARFLSPANQTEDITSEWNYAWDVPITVVTATSDASDWDAGPVAWIDIDETETTLTGLPTDLNDWVIINAKQNMFYRVFYDETSRASIANQLLTDASAIAPESRSAIIDDTFTLSRAGYFGIVDAMENTRYLNSEFVYNGWGSALKHLQYTNRMFYIQPWFSYFEDYMVSLSSPVHEQLGWTYDDSETILLQYLRRDALATACSYGDPSCLATARQQYADSVANPSLNVVDPNNLPTVLCTGVNEGTDVDWTLWLNEYANRVSSQIREERYAYLFALACTPDTTLLDRYLDELTVESNIAFRDLNQATQYLALVEYGAEILWDYLDANWNSVRSGINRWTTLNNIIFGFSTPANADRLNEFISNHPPQTNSERNTYAQMVLQVAQNIEWRNTNNDDLQNWLNGELASRSDQPLRSTASRHRSGPTPLSAYHHWSRVIESYQEDYGY